MARLKMHLIPRGCASEEELKVEDNAPILHDYYPEDAGDRGGEGMQTSLHEVLQRASVDSWNKIRSNLLSCCLEAYAMPNNQQCVICTELATHRCVQCGPCSYFCSACFNEAHSKRNLFHSGEIWEVQLFA